MIVDTFKLLSIAPKDVCITMEMSLENMKLLIAAIDHVNIKFDSKEEPEMVDAAEYLKTFYDHLTGIQKHVEGDQ